MATDAGAESELPLASFGDGRDPGTDPTSPNGYCEFELVQGSYQITSNQCAAGCNPPPTPDYSVGDPTTVRVTCVAQG